jgi:hypothetical protein
VAFPGGPLNVILKGLTLLMLATLQIPGVAQPYVSALEVAGEDLLEIFLAIDHISGQVIKPGPSHVS